MLTHTGELELLVKAQRTAIDREIGEAQALAVAGKHWTARVAALREQVELHDRVAGILNRLGEERQETAQRQIEGLVTRGLQTVFDEGLSFHVVQEIKANQSTVSFVVRSVNRQWNDTGEVLWEQTVDTPVMDARGGGMASVIGFILRLVVLLLTPGVRRVLFLDETFGMLSAEYEPRMAEFLREVAEKAGVQVVLITHSSAYDDAADTRYRFQLSADGRTQVTAS